MPHGASEVTAVVIRNKVFDVGLRRHVNVAQNVVGDRHLMLGRSSRRQLEANLPNSLCSSTTNSQSWMDLGVAIHSWLKWHLATA